MARRPSPSRRRFLQTSAALATLPFLTRCGDPQPTADGKDAALGTDATQTQDMAPDMAPDVPPPPPPDDKGQVTAFDPQAVAEDSARFSLGVQAGSPRADGAILWTRLAAPKPGEAAVPLKLRVWRDGKASDGKLPGPGEVVLARDLTPVVVDGSIKHRVQDLLPGTWYHYAFFTADLQHRSAIGKFRTAFAPGVLAPLVVGGTACTRPNFLPYPALTELAKHDLDVFCHMGDQIYGDGAKNREEYRGKWAQNLGSPGYRAVLPTCASYMTWDDHEVTNNDQRYKVPLQRRLDAVEAFFEHTPTPRHPDGLERNAYGRFWDSYRWGDTAEFFVLDCRGERQEETRETDDPIYISKTQIAWLKKGLQESPCHFKIVLNSVPIIAFPAMWPSVPDRWQGYAKQRDELLDHLTGAGIRNVWFLSGDLHLSIVARLEGAGPRAKIYEVLCGPGGNENPIAKGLVNNPDLVPDFAPPEQFLHIGVEPNATILRFDPVADTVEVKFVLPDGKVQWEKKMQAPA